MVNSPPQPGPSGQVAGGVPAGALPGGNVNEGGDSPKDPGGANPGSNTEPRTPRKTPEKGKGGAEDHEDHDKRIRRLEDLLLLQAARNKSTSYRTSRTRSTRRTRTQSRSPRRHGSHRSERTRDGRHNSSRRTRSKSKSRGSARSHRSRSRSRSTRRHRSTSRDKHRHSRSTSRQDRRRRSRSNRSKARSPSYQRNVKRDLTKELEDQYPTMGGHKGRRVSSKRLTLAPYENLPPDLLERDRRSRRCLTFQEHICGLLNTVLKVMNPAAENHAIVNHAAQVAQDAATLAWPEVRNWSQTCLSHIQEGHANWGSKDLFHQERTRLSWIRGKTHDIHKVPCLDFNEEKCTQSREHVAKGKTYLHCCAVCFYGMNDKTSPHTASKCRKKAGLKLVQDDYRPDYRKRNYQQPRRDQGKPDTNKPKN